MDPLRNYIINTLKAIEREVKTEGIYRVARFIVDLDLGLSDRMDVNDKV